MNSTAKPTPAGREREPEAVWIIQAPDGSFVLLTASETEAGAKNVACWAFRGRWEELEQRGYACREFNLKG